MMISSSYQPDEGGKEHLLAYLLAALACGLAAGLSAGLALGLLFGLLTGLIFALVFSLSAGLATGLSAGLSFGLLVGLSAGLATGLFPFSIPLLIAIVAAEEALFWLDREKLPLNRSRLSFTAQKKLEALFEIGIVMGAYSYLYGVLREASQISQFLHQVGPYAFYGAVATALVVAIVLLNSAKYRKHEQPPFGTGSD